ncbi:NAC domain-containing protein 83-like [Phalaenopsis equestris]|uniref:NAC domain-containing protein 83-like n=1 Tax=Phalaenopsis equestris TaxID=78828 RepID=UPI0009E1B5BE|nr:NAC domain-containing protein 83-like [Phalaenopsis equestris]
MANPNLSKLGALRLPPGFRFHPTDEELVLQYLKRKAFSFPLPAAIIPEVDLPKYDPWDLPGVGEQARYFFYLRSAKYPNGRRVNRAMGSGYWKITGKEKPIVASKSNQVVGMKKVLVFYHGKLLAGEKTDWFMHEYCLAGAGADAGFCGFGKRNNSTGQCRSDWVLCRIFMKRRTAEEEAVGLPLQKPQRVIQLINFMNGEERDRSSSSNVSRSSSGLSCVTENNEEVSSPS